MTVEVPASSVVADKLAQLILGNLPPGSQLPSEAEMATQYGVSRLTVREALKVLSGRGLVELSRGRRAVTRMPDGSAFSDYLLTVIVSDGRALFDLMELRLAIETQAASLASRRITRAGLSGLEDALEGMRACAAHGADSSEIDEIEFHRQDVRFHEALADASGNRVFSMLFEALAPPLFESFARSRQGQRRRGHSVDVTIAAHSAVLEAVRAGNPDAAAAAMRRHLEETVMDISVGLNTAA